MSKAASAIPIPSTATPRVERLRQKFLEYKPSIDAERGMLMGEMYETGELDHLPPAIMYAKLFKNLCEKKSIYIEDDQLIAGAFGRKPRATPVYPEAQGAALNEEYRKANTRPLDRFEYDDDERTQYEKVLDRMRGLPSIRENFFDSLTMEEKSLFLKYPEKDYAVLTQICSLDPCINGPGGHITADFQTVIEHGFDYIRRQAEARLNQARAQGDQKGVDFLTGAIISIEGIGILAKRYADLAMEKSAKETDPKRKKELIRLAQACAQVPMGPARSFYEACQSAWLSFVGIQIEACQRCFSVGRFDQMAYPLYKADIENEVITRDEAQEMLDCMWLKFAETSPFNSESFSQTTAGFSPQQQFVAGGQTPDGRDATNDLSYMEIQATINTRFGQPSISVRIWEGSPDSLIKKACELARIGTGHPSFFNDRVVVKGLVNKGILLEDARDYAIAGCSSVHPTRKDKGANNGGYINMAASVDFALHDGFWKFGNKQLGPHTGDPRNFKTYEEFADAVKKQFAYMIKIHSNAALKVEKIHRDLFPTPFLSCMVGDCITKARDRTDGGAFYNDGITARAVGFADVTDSLAAIKKLVYEDKKITMDQLLTAIDANFEGYEDIQNMLKTGVPKYGNDIDYVDSIGKDFTEFYSDEADKYRSLFGGRYHPGFSTVAANVAYGNVVAALPTGRKEYTPLVDGISPEHHMDVNGPTAVAVSAGKLDHLGMTGGSILNLKFSPGTVKGDGGLDHLTAFVKGAMESGVWHMQFNVNDVETLRAAQKEPENYSDLLVRVAGYSALFVALSNKLQEDLIDRSVHTFAG